MKTKAKYTFRGIDVLIFDKNNNTLIFGNDANMCHFINDDFRLMVKFLNDCADFKENKIKDINDIDVN